MEKSVLVPAQCITILGTVLDSVSMTVSLPPEKETATLKLINDCLSAHHITIRELARLIGKLISCTVALPLGNLYYRSLERCKLRALRLNQGKWDSNCRLNFAAKTDLQWWIQNLPHCSAPIFRPNPQLLLQTDACQDSWGAVFKDFVAQGYFSEKEKPLSINTKETLAILYGFRSFAHHFRNAPVKIESDSTTAISYVRKFGGMNSELRSKIVTDLWCLADSINSWISITHIRGIDNISADLASRIISTHSEWRLHPQMFRDICKHFNLSPQVDLFASMLNHQVSTYYSFAPDPYCTGVDAFCFEWESEKLFYCFAPFNLLYRILAKIRRDRSRVVMVLPQWQNQVWFGTMLNMLVDFPLQLPRNVKNIVTLPWNLNIQHPNLENLKLLSVVLSGIDAECKTFRDQLPSSYSMAYQDALHAITPQQQRSGTFFVSHGKLIHCNHLVNNY